jgi:hypothetical protein
MTEAERNQLIEDTKQHQKDGLITRKEMVRKLAELKAAEAGR